MFSDISQRVYKRPCDSQYVIHMKGIELIKHDRGEIVCAIGMK